MWCAPSRDLRTAESKPAAFGAWRRLNSPLYPRGLAAHSEVCDEQQDRGRREAGHRQNIGLCSVMVFHQRMRDRSAHRAGSPSSSASMSATKSKSSGSGLRRIRRGEFRLKPISKPRGWPDVKLIAVIVSGYDGDGCEALCAVRVVGGVTIAQKLETARQPDMPESAIESGCVDLVLSPEVIAMEIARIAQAQPGSGAKPSRRALSSPRPTA
jgi:hypothetical protein